MTEISPYVKAGALIRAQREAKQLTQLEVVKAMAALAVTTSEPALSRLELGENKRAYTNAEFMNALARVLGMDGRGCGKTSRRKVGRGTPIRRHPSAGWWSVFTVG